MPWNVVGAPTAVSWVTTGPSVTSGWNAPSASVNLPWGQPSYASDEVNQAVFELQFSVSYPMIFSQDNPLPFLSSLSGGIV